MGPISLDWVKRNGEEWAGGRIDIYGTDSFYPEEHTLPIMHREDWASFGDWLDEIVSPSKLSLEELVQMYEQDHSKIRWWKANEGAD
jgi:hypothetical protein